MLSAHAEEESCVYATEQRGKRKRSRSHTAIDLESFKFRTFIMQHTIQEVFDGHSNSLVESAGVGSRLKGQSKLLIARPPVMKGWHDFVVLEVLARFNLR